MESYIIWREIQISKCESPKNLSWQYVEVIRLNFMVYFVQKPPEKVSYSMKKTFFRVFIFKQIILLGVSDLKNRTFLAH